MAIAGLAGDYDLDGIRDFYLRWSEGPDHKIDIISGQDGTTFVSYAAEGSTYGFGGDLDGDGILDFVDVDRYGSFNGLMSNGMVSIRSGLTGDLLVQLFGTFNGERLGGPVRSLGDLDSDGIDEFTVGSPTNVVPGSTIALLQIYSGGTGAVIREHVDAYTRAIHRLGDVDFDGVDDYLIAYGELPAHSDSARVYSGMTGALIRSHPVSSVGVGGQYSDVLGDVDGDGVPDYAIATYRWTVGETHVYSGATGATIHEWLGNGVDFEGGFVWATGDVTGDGFADLIRSSGNQDELVCGLTGEPILGMIQKVQGAYVINGSTLHVTQPLYPLAVGDLDGDGFAEFVDSWDVYGPEVFREGRVRLIRGGFTDCGGVNYCPQLPNSSGDSATIRALGQVEAARNNFTLVLEDGPDDEFGFFLASRGQDLVVNPGGTPGNLCLGGGQGIARLHDTMGITYAGSHWTQVDLTAIPEPPFFQTAIVAGETWNFQAWFRDGASSHFSNGVTVAFQ